MNQNKAGKNAIIKIYLILKSSSYSYSKNIEDEKIFLETSRFLTQDLIIRIWIIKKVKYRISLYIKFRMN